MSYLRDIRLWLMCLLTISGTALLGVTFHGALASPKADGPGITVQAPEHPVHPPHPFHEG